MDYRIRIIHIIVISLLRKLIIIYSYKICKYTNLPIMTIGIKVSIYDKLAIRGYMAYYY